MFMARADSKSARLYRIAVFEVVEKFKGDIPPRWVDMPLVRGSEVKAMASHSSPLRSSE
jgi:hypothetical protein